ncbi:MAG: amidohydrolase [Burkholderiales bacterium]|nr:amidohydrolase [Burkholderiales bacterium]
MTGRSQIVRGSILTMDPRLPRAQAMAIRGGRIAAVGSLAIAREAAGPGAREIGFERGAVVPGLMDTHNHMFWTGMQQTLVDLRECKSIAAVIDEIRTYAARHADAAWIVSGTGWHVTNLEENRHPNRRELDRACPDRPVYLPRGGHAAAVNSLALRLAGITRDTKDPEGGRIERDASGEPNGVLREPPAFELVGRLAPAASRAEQTDALRQVQKRYHAAGLTGIMDPGISPEVVGIYQDLRAAGELTVRSVVMPLADSSRPLEEVLAGIASSPARTGFGDARLKLGGVKLYLDGAATFATALMREPYPDERCNCGIQVTPTEAFRRIVRRCAERGWSMGVHVVGGKAIDIALDVFAEVDRDIPIRDLRFCLIHAYLWPSKDNIARAAKLGVVVATQPSMQYTFGPELVKRFGTVLMGQATPVRGWLDGGVKVGGGSDSPITPYPPLLGLWQARTRHVAGAAEPVGREQAITGEEALALYTRDAAYLSFSEHERGMLKEGLLGDWTALSMDPVACDAEALRDAEVLATCVEGELVHGG